MIYLDNAATSFPKPGFCFTEAQEEYFELSASPGRGGYDAAVQAQVRVQEVRDQVAAFCRDNGFISCFGCNSIDSLNVLSTEQPVADIGRICREQGIHLILDASQSAGVTPVRLVCTAHPGPRDMGNCEDASIRGSLGLHNTISDVEALLAALSDMVQSKP